MKKFIPMQGRGIKGIVEITDKGAFLRPASAGQLWLYDGSLVRAEECHSLNSITGAVLVKDGSALMWGGIGTGEKAGKILAEATMRSGKMLPAGAANPDLAKNTHSADEKEATPLPKEEEQGHNEEKKDNNERKGISVPPNPGAALIEILKKADELFPSVQPQQKERRDSVGILNPFPEAFPFSRWRSREYPGTNRYYLEGEWLKDGTTFMIYAIPGEFRGRRHRGFPRFLRSRDGSGYWVKIQRK